MLIISKRSAKNQLVETFSSMERKRIILQCDLIEYSPGFVLQESDKTIEYAYFPLSGFVSLISALNDKQSLALSLVGCEGMIGEALVLGAKKAALCATAQSTLTVLRMTASALRREMDKNPQFHLVLKKHVHHLIMQLSQTSVCSHFHEAEPRLARWLLLMSDRAKSDQFHLTHQGLGQMLGVRRSAVTIAAGLLQQRKLIHYTRGEITILNRKGLEASACQCYGLVS